MQLKTDTGLAARPKRNRSGSRSVLILGLGNILLKDEGIGVHIAEELQKQDLPASVEVIDGGTAGLDILLPQKGLDKLVVIDALRAGKKPGTIYKARFRGGEKEKLTQIFGQGGESKISLHQVGLIDALGAAEKTGRAPEEVVIIGVEPAEWDCGLELTEPVRESIPQVIKKVLEEIEDAVHRE